LVTTEGVEATGASVVAVVVVFLTRGILYSIRALPF
jgi:hypothetical protein